MADKDVCAGCSKPIKGSCLTALEKSWHPQCFVCNGCRKEFTEKSFHTRDDKPYCDACYADKFAPKCTGCTKPISGSYVTALEGPWHAACFVCHECRQPFEKGSFYDVEGKPYCKKDYEAQNA
ncbi:transforming growth factor beta-1-induced transcript 1 protein-like [Paramacrobiotus metropolitanus]|uniref:transforming growth factor beta-1-induced transcript 1 protein-like n=1 Tax=Paramacrobiotus metropolitanus TaxID=2943436 RepID=UPI002445CDFC|nr:transforming growth factor beta-1-induced transcript 1 protein-like [Paramacrobiotus metropolitanus]